jgi:hypothetical protein
VTLTLYVSPYSLRHNPHRPPYMQRTGWRAPCYFENCRWVLMYRLLGCDVQEVARVTGISQANVRTVLAIFGGRMHRRDGTGRVIWDGAYSLYSMEAYRRLALPTGIPASVDHAWGGPAEHEGVPLMTLKLPPPIWKPRHGDDGTWAWINLAAGDWLPRNS